jgi:hypothetical protein
VRAQLGIYRQFDHHPDTTFRTDSAFAVCHAHDPEVEQTQSSHSGPIVYAGRILLNGYPLSTNGPYYFSPLDPLLLQVGPPAVSNLWQVAGSADVPQITDSIVTPVDSLTVMSPRPGDTLSISALTVKVSERSVPWNVQILLEREYYPVSNGDVTGDSLVFDGSYLSPIGVTTGPTVLKIVRTYETSGSTTSLYRYSMTFEVSDLIPIVLVP